MYKVSAIVSVYKAEKFIRGCLDDLVSQTLFEKGELEIVVVNSGSPENEDAIIREFSDKYEHIKYIRTENREGIYTAWNRGIKASSGEYITNANTDDRHRRDALEIMAKHLDEMPEIDLVYADLYVTKIPNQKFDEADKVNVIVREDFSVGMMLDGCQMGPQPMWRKSVHEKVGFFNDAYKSAGDYEFWLRMVFLNNSKMFHIKDFLGLYLFNENGIELGNRPLSVYETGVIIDTYKKYILKKQTASRKEKPIDIIFLTHDRIKYFFQTISALITNTRYPYRIIVVDNASADELKTYLRQSEILYDEIIYNKQNEWTNAFQYGIDVSESDPFIVSDPDILVPAMEGKCWLEKILELHKKYPEMGLIALNLDPANKPKKLPDVYIGEKTEYNDEIVLANVGTVMQSIKRKFFDFAYTTDWETCENIRRNGGKVGFAKKIVAYHLGWNEEEDYPDYMVEKYKFFKKHFNVETYKLYTEKEEILKRMNFTNDVVSNYYGNERPEVVKLINKKSKKILDVGCASGVMAAKIKKDFGAEVWGIEVVESVAKEAEEKIDKVLIGSVEEKIPELPDNYFDTIVFADILEHLVDPWRVLKDIKKKLKPHGEIVVSIPNIRHWSTIIDLLQGSWRYAEAGILDKTHLRFFTMETAAEMIQGAGYDILDLQATRFGESLITREFVDALKKLGFKVDDLLEKATHYQYLFKAVKLTPKNKISLIVPVYNQAKYTSEMLASIGKHEGYELEIIIVDNASDEETKNVIREFEKNNSNVKIITNTENLGFPKAINQGLAVAKGDYVFLANNDIILPPDWLERMVAHAERNKSIGMVGVVSNKVSGFQKIKEEITYRTPDEMLIFMKKIAEKSNEKFLEFPRVAFLFVLIKKEVIDKVGSLDERFSPGNYEDDDYCLRVQRAGFKAVIALDVYVHHYGSVSFTAEGKEKYYALLERNREKFVEKWGSTPDDIWLRNTERNINETMSLKKNRFIENVDAANTAIQNGDFKKAKNFLETALANYDGTLGIEKKPLEKLLEKINIVLKNKRH
jgi:GT2 family glycosyltransferase/cyclopropane fatty-acyl-phospholipid synthase-like methyltransferase